MKFIGEIYKEKILPRKDLVDKELPYNHTESQVIKDLFGYKLVVGKEQIECATEDEARYLKVFLDLGLTEIKIPKDLNFLKQIVPELESSKKHIDEILKEFTESIFDRKAKAQLRHEVYMEFARF
jgi:hypothetical protein